MTDSTTSREPPIGMGEALVDRGAQLCEWGLARMAYERRIAAAGLAMRALARAMPRLRARVTENLARVFPEMEARRRTEVSRAMFDNFGRTFAENFSPAEFMARMARLRPEGPGLAALEAARAEGRPAILVSGHFGNHQAARACLNGHGFAIGGVYRPMNNRPFNDRYVRTIEAIGRPAFPRGRRGTAGLIRHLRAGGFVGMLIDQHALEGDLLDFLGHPARTVLSAAELALKYDAPLVPVYGRRLADGLDFQITVEAAVEPADAVSMTQAINDSLAAQVRACPEQYYWLHRRWKA